jgi:hypothetical protein
MLDSAVRLHAALRGNPVKKTLLSALMYCLCSAAFAASVITTHPDDSKAIYLDAPAANADSSAALQAAIDKAAGTGREGIVFVAAGRYTLTRTIYVWPGVRVIGYGATRPVFILPPQTPGFQKGMGVMVMFAGLAPNEPTRAGGRIAFPPPGSVPPNDHVADANPNTFYSAITNIDFEIGNGNPAAVAVRFHVAQHAFLTLWTSTLVPAWLRSTRSATKARTCTSTAAATPSSPKRPRPHGSSP